MLTQFNPKALQVQSNHASLNDKILNIESSWSGLKEVIDFTSAAALHLPNQVPQEINQEALLHPSRAIIFKNGRNNRHIIYPLSSISDTVSNETIVYKDEIDLNRVTPGKRPLPMGYFDSYYGIVYGNDILFETPIQIKELSKQTLSLNTKYSTLTLKLEYKLSISHSNYSNTLGFHSLKLDEAQRLGHILKHVNKVKKSIRRKAYTIRKFVFKSIYVLTSLTRPVKPYKVVFASDSREDLSGNFEYIYNEMLKRDVNFDVHFHFKKSLKERRSFKDKFRLPYDLATAGTILLDDYYPLVYPLKIRRKSKLIQVWHAVGAFKTFGYSRIGKPGGPSANSLNHRNYTHAIVSSKNIARHYAEGFGIFENQVVATGIPRTDLFFDKNLIDQKTEELFEKYPILKEKKVIMFAPTFRGNGQRTAHYPFDVLDWDQLYKELSDEYVFILKLHPFVTNKPNIPIEYQEFFLDFTEYREINDLLFISDILVTDYSSTCFEFALLQRPMMFFAFDLEEYISSRDFYYPYESFVPGPILRNSEELIHKIKNEEFEMDKLKSFTNEFFDHLDGQSSKRFVDQLILGMPDKK